MNIEQEIADGVLKLVVEGSINTATSTSFEKAVMDNINDVEGIVVDLAKTDYISSAGLRVFMRAYQILNKPDSITVLNASDEIKEVFDLTMFSEVLDIR